VDLSCAVKNKIIQLLIKDENLQIDLSKKKPADCFWKLLMTSSISAPSASGFLGGFDAS
jgi:hypothetical protein